MGTDFHNIKVKNIKLPGNNHTIGMNILSFIEDLCEDNIDLSVTFLADQTSPYGT